MAITVTRHGHIRLGTIDDESQKLLDVTEESLYLGLNEAKPGERLSNISHAYSNTMLKRMGFQSLREYVGHGVGQDLHEDLKSLTMVHQTKAQV